VERQPAACEGGRAGDGAYLVVVLGRVPQPSSRVALVPLGLTSLAQRPQPPRKGVDRPVGL